MLKKAGIVTATAVAGLLALSPLAFAGDYDGGHDGGHHGHHSDHGDHGDDRGGRDHDVNIQRGLVNVQGLNLDVPVQLCNTDLLGGVLGVLASHQSNHDSHRGSCRQN